VFGCTYELTTPNDWHDIILFTDRATPHCTSRLNKAIFLLFIIWCMLSRTERKGIKQRGAMAMHRTKRPKKTTRKREEEKKEEEREKENRETNEDEQKEGDDSSAVLGVTEPEVPSVKRATKGATSRIAASVRNILLVLHLSLHL
jgi:hypothetical protein